MSEFYQKERLLEIADGDQEFLKKLVETFIDEVHQDLYSLEEAILNENRGLTFQYAHKMQPNIETFGISSQGDIKTIEEWSRTSKSKTAILENLQNLLNLLHQVFDELKKDFDL